MRLKVKFSRDRRYIYSHIRRKWVSATDEEVVRQEFVCRLVNLHGLSLDQMREEWQVGPGQDRVDLAIWKSPEEQQRAQKGRSPFPLIVVEFKAHSNDRKGHYEQAERYALLSRARFFITHSPDETRYWMISDDGRIEVPGIILLGGKTPTTVAESGHQQPRPASDVGTGEASGYRPAKRTSFKWRLGVVAAISFLAVLTHQQYPSLWKNLTQLVQEKSTLSNIAPGFLRGDVSDAARQPSAFRSVQEVTSDARIPFAPPPPPGRVLTDTEAAIPLPTLIPEDEGHEGMSPPAPRPTAILTIGPVGAQLELRNDESDEPVDSSGSKRVDDEITSDDETDWLDAVCDACEQPY